MLYLYFRVFCFRIVTKEHNMDILKAKKFDEINEGGKDRKNDLQPEKNPKNRIFNFKEKFRKIKLLLCNWKSIWKDIVENFYLIIVSLVPIIFCSILGKLNNSEVDWVREVVSSADLMLVPIPYILHCVLAFVGRKFLRFKQFFVGWSFLVIIWGVFLYLALKLKVFTQFDSCVKIIWIFIFITLVTGVIGSVLAFRKERE